MQAIITQILSILKKNDSLFSSEAMLKLFFEELTKLLMEYALKQYEQECIHQYKTEGWELERKESRTINFTFGEVTFKRYRMRKEGEKSVIPLDKSLSLPAREHYSPGAKGQMIAIIDGMTYRKAAETINSLCPYTVSHQSLHKVVQKEGKLAKEWLKEDIQCEDELKKVKHLFIEADGVLIKSKAKGKHEEIHRAVVHEGVKKVGGRTVLINARMITSMLSSRQLLKEVSFYIESHYKTNDTIIITNSDGGSGYEYDKFNHILGNRAAHEHFTDSYHVNQKIQKRLAHDPEMIILIRKAIYEHNWEKVVAVLDTAESRCLVRNGLDVSAQLNEIQRLKNYLYKHWPYLQPRHMRPHEVPRGGIGVIESKHRRCTYRMKYQGRNWTKSGAENMVTLITLKENGLLEAYLRRKEIESSVLDDEPIEVTKRRMSTYLKETIRDSKGALSGRIPNSGSTSSSIGVLRKSVL
ncbi:ISLre2 family transposase [Tuanshanicoccus lijuaniae]|uniref:ISLre2 family transposase n=1 Tax=Aerococcaceae bacterium zg-1292 TaxID=2774330 RepID=UPI001934D59B|nr:ISLre2 family transposase [Aerococcaceae bacterium zg-1292]QQA36701.1 ISLre2 family transposase [Aerococcaceae bacterium zg-1292]